MLSKTYGGNQDSATLLFEKGILKLIFT